MKVSLGQHFMPPAKPVALIWCHDSIAIIDKLLSLGRYLESLGFQPVWISRARPTKMAFWVKNQNAHALMDLLRIQDSSRVDDACCDGWQVLTAFERQIGLRPIPISGDLKDYYPRLVCFLRNAWQACLATYRPHLVINLNGQTVMSSLLSETCKKHHVPMLYWENGLIPDSLSIDTKGVNALAAAAQPKQPADEQDQLFAEYAAAYTEWREQWLGKATTLLQQGEPLDRKSLRQTMGISTDDLMILLPLQVDTDTNVILHSPHIGSSQQLIDLMSAVASQLPRLTIVVKDHPKRVLLGGKLDTDALLAQGHHYLEEGHLHSLLGASDAVVTINSTVGFEALLKGRPVICLGRAVYSGQGATLDLADHPNPHEALSSYFGQKALPLADTEMVQRLSVNLLEHYIWSTDDLGPLAMTRARLATWVAKNAQGYFMPEEPNQNAIDIFQTDQKAALGLKTILRGEVSHKSLLLQVDQVHRHVEWLTKLMTEHCPGLQVGKTRFPLIQRLFKPFSPTPVFDCRTGR